MNRGGKRMAVLRDEEIKQIYGLPRFTEEQRNTYFALNPAEKQEVTKLRSVKTRVYFILQLGYFKAKKILFVFEPAEVKADASHILQRYYSEQDECDTNLIFSYYIRNDHQKRILRLMNYQRAAEQIRSELLQKAIAPLVNTIMVEKVFHQDGLLGRNQKVFIMNIIGSYISY